MSVTRCSFIIIAILFVATQCISQEYEPAAQPTWRSVSSNGPAPSARYGHTMVFMSKQGKVLLFGGIDEMGNYLGDTWAWDVVSQQWTFLSDAGPRARAFHAMAYDSIRNVVILQGGIHDDGDYSPSTWVWTGAKWEYRTGDGPGMRSGHKMVFDVARRQVVLFGGFRNYGLTWESYDDTWIWQNGAWSEATSNNPPRYRHGHAMVYDIKNMRVLMQGGQHSLVDAADDGVLSKHIFEWTGNSWRLITDGGPGYRKEHELFVEPSTGDVLTLGGDNRGGTFSSYFWRFTGNSWNRIFVSIPPTRKNYAAVTDSKTNRVWLWGGLTSSGDVDARVWYLQGGNPFDLKLDRLKAKPRGSYLAGEEIILVLRVKNISDTESEDYTLEVYLSLDQEIDSFDAQLLNLTVTTPIKAGKKKKIKLLSEIPGNVVADDYWLIARLTSAKAESNSNNNLFVSKKRVVIE